MLSGIVGFESPRRSRVTKERQKAASLACDVAVLSHRTVTEYLAAAMAKAHYELLGDGEGFYGEIPGFQGVLAQGNTLEACREELASTLEDWLLFRIFRQLAIPTVNGLDLTVREVEVAV